MLTLIADDSYAMTFQSFGQYRAAGPGGWAASRAGCNSRGLFAAVGQQYLGRMPQGHQARASGSRHTDAGINV